MEVIGDFSVKIVQNTADHYNKAFHAKLFTLFASSESEVYTFSGMHKPHYNFCFCFLKGEEGQWFLDNNSLKETRDWVIGCAKEDMQGILSLYDRWRLEWGRYTEFDDELRRINLSALSDKNLFEVFHEFYKKYLFAGSVAYIADSFMSTGQDDWLEKMLLDEIPNSTIKIVRKITSPVHLSFALESDGDLLNIGLILNGKFPSFSKLEKDVPGVFSMLRRHEQNYHWIQNNYHHVNYITAGEFYMQAKKLYGHELTKNKRREIDEIIESLKVSDFARNLLIIARLFSKWKDVRKSGVYMGMYHFDRFLAEFAKRTDYSKEELTFLVFHELKSLLGGKNFKDEIKRRKDGCFFAVTPKGYFIASGKDAQKYFVVFDKQNHKNTHEIKGVAACGGKARGSVRIIKRTSDMKDFREGEVLVANQTTPEFVPIMKKAAAIVTEQGGITSHAAVVSRELEKPCIIGTKNASSMLMDGEIVEIDAEKGVVKRVR